MKKSEIIIYIIQILAFYFLPKDMVNLGPFGVVFLLLIITFSLSLIIGTISHNKIKYYYPIITSLSFIPTIWIYYNESALIHVIWYLVISSIGLFIGITVDKIVKKDNKSK